jgi:tRNA C32,U32 (ribose-2'-O)-methylase TrmJ
LAPTKELETMYEHMERTLAGIGFLGPGNPKRMMTSLRRLFGRSHLNQREVQILQGIWSQMDWYLRRDEERRR